MKNLIIPTTTNNGRGANANVISKIWSNDTEKRAYITLIFRDGSKIDLGYLDLKNGNHMLATKGNAKTWARYFMCDVDDANTVVAEKEEVKQIEPVKKIRFSNKRNISEAKQSISNTWVSDSYTTEFCKKECKRLAEVGINAFYKKTGDKYTVYSYK